MRNASERCNRLRDRDDRQKMDRYGDRDGYKNEVNTDIEMKLEIET